MTFEIEVGDRMRSVEARGPEALLDGRRFHVDAARAGHVWSLLLGPVDLVNQGRVAARPDESALAGRSAFAVQAGPTRSYEVSVVERAVGDLTVYVDGHPVSVRSSPTGDGRQRFGARPRRAGAPASVGAQRVLAPMPGRVAKVLVKVGDVVAIGQGLVVVEAMKMENELRSPGAGTVTEVPAVEGALVEANAVLVVIDC